MIKYRIYRSNQIKTVVFPVTFYYIQIELALPLVDTNGTPPSAMVSHFDFFKLDRFTPDGESLHFFNWNVSKICCNWIRLVGNNGILSRRISSG